jgi:hypothetical protein
MKFKDILPPDVQAELQDIFDIILDSECGSHDGGRSAVRVKDWFISFKCDSDRERAFKRAVVSNILAAYWREVILRPELIAKMTSAMWDGVSPDLRKNLERAADLANGDA